MRILLTICLLIVHQAVAQVSKPSCRKPAVVLSATQQSWAGGVKGRAGVNYVIELATMPNVIPDTVWLGKTPYPIIVRDAQAVMPGGDNATVVKEKKQWRYVIRIGEDLSEWHPVDETAVDNRPKPSTKAPLYDGKAYIVYTFKSKRNDVAIHDFMRLEPIHYP